MLDDNCLVGAGELQRVVICLRRGEINCDSRRVGKSLERLREIFSADSGCRLRR